MSSQAHHLRRLATAFAAGPMVDREALVARAKPMVGDLRKARWLAWVRFIHPGKEAKLREIFERIDWGEGC